MLSFYFLLAIGNMSQFYGSLSTLRSGQELSPHVVQQAREHCKGGHSVKNLSELYSWMLEQNPEMPFFDTKIATGPYPHALAAFATSCPWEQWKVHAVFALHGDLYLNRLKVTKLTTDDKTYRDHFAGASMHRANGLMHMVRCAEKID